METSIDQLQKTEFDRMKIVLLRLVEEGIITDFQKQQIESKSELREQKLGVYELMRSLEWKSSIRILQLIKYIRADQSNPVTSERNPLLIQPILKHLFGFLSHCQLKELRLVCKKWDDVADPLVKKNSVATFSKLATKENELIVLKDFLSIFTNSKVQITTFQFAWNGFSTVDLDEFFSQCGRIITDVYLYDCDFTLGNEKLDKYDITTWMSHCPLLEELRVVCDLKNTHLSISLDMIPQVKFLRLKNCSVNIRNDLQVHPIEIFFGDVSFTLDGNVLEEFCINEVINFDRTKVAEIGCSKNFKCKAALDVSTSTKSEIISIEGLLLLGGRLRNWSEGNWVVTNCHFESVDLLTASRINIVNMSFTGNSTIDLAALPPTVEILCFLDPNLIVTCTQPVNFQKLKHLTLQGNISNISHFTNCPNLAELEMKCYDEDEEVVTFSDIPRAIQKMKLCGITIEDTVDDPIYLLKLILVDYTFADAFYLTKLFPPELTVLKWDCKDTFEVAESFVKFMLNFTLNFFVVGSFPNVNENSTLQQYVDNPGNNYIFRGRSGLAIEEEEFNEFTKLSNDQILKDHHLPPFH